MKNHEVGTVYPVNEVANLAGIKPATIYTHIKQGSLYGFKFMGRTVVPEKELIAWLKHRDRRATELIFKKLEVA